MKEIPIPGNAGKFEYDPLARVGVRISKIGTNRTVSLGVYAFALKAFDVK